MAILDASTTKRKSQKDENKRKFNTNFKLVTGLETQKKFGEILEEGTVRLLHGKKMNLGLFIKRQIASEPVFQFSRDAIFEQQRALYNGFMSDKWQKRATTYKHYANPVSYREDYKKTVE